MTLSKLSLRNARRQAADYLVYFVTIVLVAALLYAFNGLVFSTELRALSRQMALLPPMIVLASVVVVCIIGWLVSYTTKYMLTRRSRELGTYILIGLENNQVARMFLLENLAVGGCALILGLLLGNLLYQALRAFVLALFGVSYYFSFSFSGKAVALTLLYFVFIYLLAQLKSRKRIRSMKICQLIYYDRQNEGPVVKTGKVRRLMFVVSILLGVAGTLCLMAGSFMCIIGTCLLIGFLYGFFLSFASGVPAFFEKRPSRKYRGQRLLVFRTLTAKLGTMGVLMATISLLFMATVLTVGLGMVFNGIFWGRVEKNNCFDLVLAAHDSQEAAYGACLDYMRENIPLRETWSYDIYLLDTDQLMAYTEAGTRYYRYYEKDAVMKESDYMALRDMLGYPAVTLAPGQYLIHCQPYVEAALKGFSGELYLGGAVLKRGETYTEVLAQNMYDFGNGPGYVLVVPDELVEGCPVNHRMYVAMASEPVTEEQYDKLFAFQEEILQKQEADDTMLYVREADEEEAAAMTASTVYPLYYLALVLAMTAATILTIQQLGEARHYRQQFALLGKLGMDRGEMGKALRTQFTIYYLMPAIPPVLVGVPVIKYLAGSVEPGTMVGIHHPLVIIGMALGMFFLIYGIYILLAYSSMKGNVLQE